MNKTVPFIVHQTASFCISSQHPSLSKLYLSNTHVKRGKNGPPNMLNHEHFKLRKFKLSKFEVCEIRL